MNWMKNFLFEDMEWDGRGGSVIKLLGSLFANVWAFLMLAVFPLYAPDRYFGLGDHKFRFFLYCSVICLIPALVLLSAGWCVETAAGQSKKTAAERSKKTAAGQSKKMAVWIRNNLSPLDLAVLCYLAAAAVSWACSNYRQAAWIGAEGWFMGLRTQLLLATAYFCLSRSYLAKKILLAGHIFGSGAACLFGVLHRFLVDPLGMYEGISESYYLEFLSTVGQATWFSSYVCTVLVIGIAFFFLAKKTYVRVLWGMYCMLGFATVVTQNSDSAFLAMGALFLGLFCAACRRMDWMERYLETMILMLGSFKIVGILQQVFAKRAIQLDGISVFFAQSTETWLALLAVAVLYMTFLGYRMKHENLQTFPFGRGLSGTAIVLGVLAAAGYGLTVWANTTGKLPVQMQHQYLLFDEAWGNYRGLIWKVAALMFSQMNVLQKWIGAGPDCFQEYCYRDPVWSDMLNSVFGNGQVVTNAHNEFLNVLICLGMLGLLAFLAILATAAGRFLGAFCCKRDFDPLVLAGGLAVLTYCAHNFFCYQQVCCTPYLFLILAMAENRMRSKKWQF